MTKKKLMSLTIKIFIVGLLLLIIGQVTGTVVLTNLSGVFLVILGGGLLIYTLTRKS